MSRPLRYEDDGVSGMAEAGPWLLNGDRSRSEGPIVGRSHRERRPFASVALVMATH